MRREYNRRLDFSMEDKMAARAFGRARNYGRHGCHQRFSRHFMSPDLNAWEVVRRHLATRCDFLRYYTLCKVEKEISLSSFLNDRDISKDVSCNSLYGRK